MNEDGSINYEKHPSKTKIKQKDWLEPIYETTCNNVWNVFNLTFTEECTTETVGYTNESVITYGLSMETRVAEMERIIYNLWIDVQKIKEK